MLNTRLVNSRGLPTVAAKQASARQEGLRQDALAARGIHAPIVWVPRTEYSFTGAVANNELFVIKDRSHSVDFVTYICYRPPVPSDLTLNELKLGTLGDLDFDKDEDIRKFSHTTPQEDLICLPTLDLARDFCERMRLGNLDDRTVDQIMADGGFEKRENVFADGATFYAMHTAKGYLSAHLDKHGNFTCHYENKRSNYSYTMIYAQNGVIHEGGDKQYHPNYYGPNVRSISELAATFLIEEVVPWVSVTTLKRAARRSKKA